MNANDEQEAACEASGTLAGLTASPQDPATPPRRRAQDAELGLKGVIVDAHTNGEFS